MKKLLCVLVAAFSLTAIAKGENFEARKKMLAEHLSKRIATLNEQKSCIAKASKQEDIKACHQNSRGKMKALSAQKKEHHSKMKAQREAKKAERKANKKQ